MNGKKLLTAKELAPLICRSVISVYRGTRDGSIPAIGLLNKHKLYDLDEVLKYIRDQSSKPKETKKPKKLQGSSKKPDLSRVINDINEALKNKPDNSSKNICGI